jgi:hypothetical protein
MLLKFENESEFYCDGTWMNSSSDRNGFRNRMEMNFFLK